VEPVGGASRFVELVKQLKQRNPEVLTIFSGDIFSPSFSKYY
jgi:2',3'-cyclic-nucleotide 2'-phosphodiesterase (5'-nucleotidase family)